MAQGREGRAVPVKRAQEKDQPPAVECSEHEERGGREEQGGGEMQQTQCTSTSGRWAEAKLHGAQKPRRRVVFIIEDEQ